ncbi:MAG: alpha/beta hydrolase [Rhodospirillaceae bacterium]|nr:alpha/beta hydrolase [Rhodospirillaceae bacterium]
MVALVPLSVSALDYKMVPGAGGAPLNVMEAGDKTKPSILLIHGFAQSHLSFAKQLESPELTRDYHLVAMDLRGHGNSAKPWRPEDYKDSKIWADDVIAVMEATGLQKPVIVGWSYGGFIVANVIEHYGTARMAGINLVGSAGGLLETNFAPPANAEIAKQMAANRARQVSGNIAENMTGAKGAMGFLTAKPGDQAWQDLAYAGNLLLLPYVRTALAGRSLDNTKVLPKINVPTLITRGSVDSVITQEQAEKLVKAIPGATQSIYEGVGHSPFYEAPGRFNRELAAFAKSVAK